jgi:beta-N-acetylhexosaminidase
MGKITRDIGQRLLLAFDGFDKPSAEVLANIKKIKPAGFTLFRSMNIKSAAQVCQLTSYLQQLALDLGIPPFLICADQEGGQLMAVGDGTPLPGNMALGATRSSELAYKAGKVLGSELSALGINVNYAPSADVNINPRNPVIGTRSFGDDPEVVGTLASALIAGIQSQGVAATVKHFPGHGDTQVDTHLGLLILTHSIGRLKAVELPPFGAAIKAGVKCVMTAHLGIQALDGEQAPPATLSYHAITGLLRQELGFDGVVISDAMDMGAIRQGDQLGEQAIKACQAGVDLLLLTADPKEHRRIYEALVNAIERDSLSSELIDSSLTRIAELKNWIASRSLIPDLSVIRCFEHMRVADEIAEKSITLVRDRENLLPLQLSPDKRIAVLVPEPKDLTPADTSSYEKPALAEEIRAFHPNTQRFSIPFAPGDQDIKKIIASLREFDLIIAGTINACSTPSQAELINQLVLANKPVIAVAMRLPYDAEVLPQVGTCLCCYSILEPSMRAVAKALFGRIPISGKLPVLVKDIY